MIEKDIIILYESGLTIREIAEKESSSYEAIRKILKGKVKWCRNYITDFTPQQINDIVDKFDNNISIKEIARWYEISAPAISRLLKANGRTPISTSRKYDILRQSPINSIQKQFLVGTLLGDGCLYKDTSNGNYKLSFGHCEAQEQYFHWKIAVMDPFINNFRRNLDKRGNSVMLQTCTICHQDFKMFGDMFYDESRIKRIPDNLDLFFTPLALAVWVQDDGNLKSGVNMRIASMGFTKEDNEKLKDYLKRCFDLDSKVMEYNYKEKKYHQITLNKINTQKLSDIIRPFVSECMKYKIMPESSTTNMPNI